MQTDAGEVSEDEEEQDETVVMNGDCKLERQNSKQGSLKRQIVKVNLTDAHPFLSLQYRPFLDALEH